MSSRVTSRAYAGPSDLATLHELARAVWRVDKPRALPHVGDVTWGLYQHEPALESPKQTRIFELDGRSVAFGMLWLPQTLQPAVHPEHRTDDVYDALLEWFEGAADEDVDGGLDVQLLASDRSLADALERRGYAPLEGEQFEHRARSLLAPVESQVLPDGYLLRAARGDEDVERRVDVHRAVWEPSKFTEPAYRRLRTLPPYRADLDLVVEAPDGSFAAYAQVWLDEENAVGELEPVGTHPAHRNRGLATAVCLEACRRLRELGADTAVVYSVEGAPAGRVYERAGFAVVDRHVEYRLAVPRFKD